VRLGQCGVALTIEGVAGALIEFPRRGDYALPAGMIVFVVFAATRTAPVLNRNRSGSDLDLGGRLGYLPIEVPVLEYRRHQANHRAEQGCYLQAGGDFSSTWT
jgi:hypothetical protein